MRIRCSKCGAEWDSGRECVGVRDECPECSAFIHMCLNCERFSPSSRTCTLPDTEEPAGPDRQNFCEEFTFDGQTAAGEAVAESKTSAPGVGDARARFEALFKDPDS